MKTEDSELLKQFETFTVNLAEFSHRRHLEVAYEMLHKYGFLETCTKYSNAIKTFASNAGVPEKFNVTVTFAFLSLLAERIHASTEDSFDAFLKDNQDLLSKDALAKWYTPEQLESDYAREHFLLPRIKRASGD